MAKSRVTVCWISKATRARAYARARAPTQAYTSTRSPTHARTQKYVILFAFPLQQWFRKRTSLLRCTMLLF
jgi:hypothetical protein